MIAGDWRRLQCFRQKFRLADLVMWHSAMWLELRVNYGRVRKRYETDYGIEVKSNHPTNVKKNYSLWLGDSVKTDMLYWLGLQGTQTGTKTSPKEKSVQQQISRKSTKENEWDREMIYWNIRKKADTDRVPLVISFTKQLPDIHKIIRDRMDILKKSDRMRRVFSDPPLKFIVKRVGR